jgi:hypothetical protein
MSVRIYLLCVVSATLGCDPGINRTFHMDPVPPVQADTASPELRLNPLGRSASDGATSAVEQVVLQFGLQRARSVPKHCTEGWDFQYPHSQRALYVCLVRKPDHSVEVAVAEILTSTWSLKADSLLNALSGTLAKFGTVRVTEDK